MKNKRKAITLSIVAIITLITLIIGATYAYFQVAGDSSKSTDVNVTTYTSDLLTFEMGSDIAIYATQTSFGSGKGNATGSTFAKAILTANSKTNKSTKRYFMYLNISENTFTYTQNEDTPELLLKVTDASGNEITSVTGLEHKTVTDAKGESISGFDITTKSGLVTLLNFREITASPTKTDEWNVTVTLVNYNANQNGNTEKSFNAKLMIQEDIIPQIVSDICEGGASLATCITALAHKSTSSFTNIYHHDSSLANGAGDNSYRYAGANPNNYVCFGSEASTCSTDNLYRIIGVFGDNYHGVTGKQLVKLIKYDYATSALLGIDGDYNGSYSPSEYGVEETYQGSLTKLDYYYWNNDTSTNTWSESLLNKTNLNTNFINIIGSNWSKKIATTTWKVGGNAYANIRYVVPATAYQNEVVNPATNTTDNATTYSAKIGLMYASDYGFCAVPEAWTTTLYNYDGSVNGATIRSQNWMHMGNYEWTISRVSDISNYAFRVRSAGRVGSHGVSEYFHGVRPTFFLEPTVTYVSGTGTQSDPIIIN